MKQNKKYNNKIQNSLNLDKNLKLINKDKNIENLIQDINIINNNILRYNQIEDLLKSDKKYYDNEKDDDIINLQKYLDKIELNQNNIKDEKKQKLIGDCKQLCNKVYSPVKTIETERDLNRNFCVKNIKPYKNSIKEAMNSIFRGNKILIRNRYIPLKYNKTNNDENKLGKLSLSKNNNNYSNDKDIYDKQINIGNGSNTDRVINDYKSSKKYQNNFYLPRTIETDRRINVSYGNYASNSIKFKHPRFYVLNTNATPGRKKLPPIKEGKLNTVDLLRKNNSNFNMLLKNKSNKFVKYYLDMRMKEFIKFKVS